MIDRYLLGGNTHPYAYIAIEGSSSGEFRNDDNGNTVAVVDLETNELVDTIITGEAASAPWFVVASSDGRYVYVTNYRKHLGETSFAGENFLDATDNTGEVVVIQTSDNTIIARIEVGYNPEEMVITPDDRFLYVANYAKYGFGDRHTISKIDTRTFEVETIDLDHAFEVVGKSPRGMAISPDGRLVYIISDNSNSDDGDVGALEILDVATDKVVGATYLAYHPRTAEVRADGERLYVTNTGLTGNLTDSSLSIVDVSNPRAPLVIENFTFTYDDGSEMTFAQLDITKDHLYVVPTPGMAKFDISSDELVLLEIWPIDDLSYVWGVAVDEDNIVTSGDPNLVVVLEDNVVQVTEGIHSQGIAIVNVPQ